MKSFRYDYLNRLIDAQQQNKRVLEKNKFYGGDHARPGTPLKANTFVYRDSADSPIVIGKDGEMATSREPDPPSLVLVFHGTEIARFYADGMERIESDYNSITTRDRHNEYIVGGWRVFGEREPLITGPSGFSDAIQHELRTVGLYGFHFRHPFHSGALLGWSPTHEEQILNMRSQLGDADATESLARRYTRRAIMCDQHDECRRHFEEPEFEEMAVDCHVSSRHAEAWASMAYEISAKKGKKWGGLVQRDVKKMINVAQLMSDPKRAERPLPDECPAPAFHSRYAGE